MMQVVRDGVADEQVVANKGVTMDTVTDGEEEGKGIEVDEDVSENQTYTINVGDFLCRLQQNLPD